MQLLCRWLAFHGFGKRINIIFCLQWHSEAISDTRAAKVELCLRASLRFSSVCVQLLVADLPLQRILANQPLYRVLLILLIVASPLAVHLLGL